MPSNNLTIRYSKMSAVGETVAGTDLLLVGQPDATNPKTGYGVYKTTVADLTEHFKSIFRAGGLKDIIQIGPGIKGDGSPGSLELDEEYFDNLAIRTDKLSLSYVGDRAFPVLPIGGSYFTINIGGDIPVLLNGALGVIPGQSIDLANYSSGSPANKTFYFYAVEINKEVHFEILTSPMNETLSRTLFAVAKTNNEVVTNVKANPFSRLGLYRLSVSPQGSSVPFTQGSYANYVDRFWLTRWYGDKNINWDDYFIPETIIEGPVYQVLTLAPGAKLELVVYGAGGGGGGSRYTGGNFDPAMNGVGSEASSISIDDTKYVTLTGASGGTEGWWGNGSHFQNGTAGVGGVASVGSLNIPGVVIEEIRTADGNAGKGGWDRANAGGVKANLALPTNVPTLPTYGTGGKGADGLGDEGLSYGGGGGSGPAAYIRVRNVNTGPILIGFDIPEAGTGGKSSRNGSDGAQGVAWYRQIPKV